MTEPYVLHYAPDNASFIIRLALEELALPYVTRLVDRTRDAQRSESYLALNPAGRIPTLETPDGSISETGAILLWLGDRHGGLVPAVGDPMRGTFLNWLFFVSNTLHADAVALFYTARYGPPGALADMQRMLRTRILRHLSVLDRDAAPRLTGWLADTTPSALDIYVAAILRWIQLYPDHSLNGTVLLDLPRLTDICTSLEKRASVAKLCQAEGMSDHPFTQPDTPNPPEGSAL